MTTVLSKTDWTVGDLVYHQDKVWRVGLINDSRMRLDPVTGSLHELKDGIRFVDYGKCINVSRGALLEKYDVRHHGELTPVSVGRLGKLKKEAAEMAEEPEDRDPEFDEEEEEEEEEEDDDDDGGPEPEPAVASKSQPQGGVASMPQLSTATASTAAPKTKKPRAPKLPVAVAATPAGRNPKEKERLASLKARQEAAKVAKPAKPKVAKSNGSDPDKNKYHDCLCGCKEQVKGYFAMGHDGRFKGWLLRVERGDMTLDQLPPSVKERYKWVRRDDGFIPTTNYKGERHEGYISDRRER